MIDETSAGHGQSNGTQHESEAQNAVTKTTGSTDVAEEGKFPDMSAELMAAIFSVTVTLPRAPFKTDVMVSTQEQVQDLRQSLMESPAGLQYTCFHLEYQQQRLNDYVEIAQVAHLGQDSEITLIEDAYSEKEARTHLIRIRDLIGVSSDGVDSVQGLAAGISLHDAVCCDQKLPEYDLDAPADISVLHAPPSPPSIKTVKSLALSPWNPPPTHLRQRGHLLYLQLTTNEGKQHEITAHISGFFVNRSNATHFNPAPKGPSQHSLFTLISRLSPAFDKAFAALLDANQKRDPLVNFLLTQAAPASPWTVAPSLSSLDRHEPDVSRCQEAYLMAGLEGNETMRDWNEEIQSTREMPHATVQERVFRERLMLKVCAEFTNAATRGAVLVARDELSPLNPMEPKDAQIYVYNNIFYSFGADGVGIFAAEGGDEAARSAVAKDVAGVQAINQLDVPDLSTAGTIIVDYLGRRIVAQTIVPGIFKQRDPDEPQVDYGGVEGREHVVANDAFIPAFSQVGRAMRIKRHPVWDSQGQRHELESSVETKGLLGTDGRKYILDLYRLTPLDIDWIEKHGSGEDAYLHRMTVLRPELIETYWRLQLREYIKTSENKRIEGSSAVTNDSEQDDGKERRQNNEQDHDDRIAKFALAFNPDVFCGQEPQTEQEKIEWAADEKLVRDACRYLHEDVFTGFINEVTDGEAGFPVDGISLGRLMHRRGINMRYLGALASRCDTSFRGQALKALIRQEMIARAFKHVARGILRHLPVVMAAHCLAHLLNCLLTAPKTAYIDNDLQDLYPEADISFSKFTHESFTAQIARQVFLRYRYRLESDWQREVKTLPVVRSISLKLGLQLVMVPGKQIFCPEDITSVVPVVKHSEPTSVLAEEALEAGKISMVQGQKDIGQELLLESLTLHEQIYGVLHPQVARVYHQLATLYFQLDEKSAAIELAHKAVVIFERTEGLDASETVLSYLNLALFEHSNKNSALALRCVYYALDVWKIIYGERHPDAITTLNNAAVMLQHLQMYRDSRMWFERSLALSEAVSGSQSAGTGTLLFQLAQALVLDGDHKGAVHRMREAYSIFLKLFGAQHTNTKESERWLEQLTQNAVSMAKHAKDTQTRRTVKQLVFAPSSAASRPTIGPPAASPSATAAAGDSRNIDELIKFIEGGGSVKQASRAPKKHRHGLTRQRQRAGTNESGR